MLCGIGVPGSLPPSLRGLRVAFAHDWLLTWRGGEKVLAAMAELFPGAPIVTLFHEAGGLPDDLAGHPIQASFLDRLPGSHRYHRSLLPLFPLAVRSLKLPEVDLVISSSHCAAKAVVVPRGARHLSYVHAPLRYMWDRFGDYFGPGKASLPVRLGARWLRPALRAWDVVTATQVDRFVANSRHVAGQVRQRYHRYARVISPPFDAAPFERLGLEGSGRGGYFLCLGALAPYKRIDVAVEAFRRTGQELWIVGSGQSSQWLEGLPPNIKALGQVPDEALPDLYRNARALVFPGVEDFGLTPLEAQAAGRPVIAFAEGGALETVTARTGVFFPEQSPAALVEALGRFEAFERGFHPEQARAQAARFGKAAFQRALLAELELLMAPAPG
jgi:glycosyltransferase involved in cell wall biosynthesis